MVFKKRSFLSVIAAAALLAVTMTASAPHSASASDPGFGDGPPKMITPKPCTVWINNGESASVKAGESVCVRAEPEPFVAPVKAQPDDLTRLTDWLKVHDGASYADVLKFIQVEKLTIPQDVLTKLQNVLGGTGITPGPSSEPGINALVYLWSINRVVYVDADHQSGNCGIAVGAMGSGQNNTPYPGSVEVSVTGTVSNSASMKTGTTNSFLTSELGFSVTRSYSISTTYTATDVPRYGYVIVRGYKMGLCHQYHYYIQKWDVYYNTDTWRNVEYRNGDPSHYRGVAFQYQYMHLVADVQ